MNSSTSKSLLFIGLDGSNPLAFLAALGALRTFQKMNPVSSVKLGWKIEDNAWRPFLASHELPNESEQFCDSMSEWLSTPPQASLFSESEIGDNLTISPLRFHSLAQQHLNSVTANELESIAALEFLAAFGTDATHQPHSKDRTLMQDSALRTMSGAGHQHFLKFMREIIANTSSSHLFSTLFRTWTYEDEGRGMNLRWDPNDDRRYAMRWKNPSSDPAVTMRGANRLAMEGIPFFPGATMVTQFQTTGFRVRRGAYWSWPIWESPLELAVIQGLLQVAAISETVSPEQRTTLSRQGIAAIFKSQRITVGKFRNFTPAKSV